MFWCLQENSIFKQHHPQKKKKTNSYKPPKKQTTKPLEKNSEFFSQPHWVPCQWDDSMNDWRVALGNFTPQWFFQPFKPKGSETAEPKIGDAAETLQVAESSWKNETGPQQKAPGSQKNQKIARESYGNMIF